MRKKEKGIGYLQLLAVLAALVLLGVIAVFGIGEKKLGSASDVKLGLDLAGGVSITYEAVKENPTAQEMEDTRYKLQLRVDNYSTESAVYQEGDNRINVDIPGVTDANAILKELGKAGALQFKDEDGNVVLEGSDVETAEPMVYSQNGLNQYAVSLTLTEEGAKKFEKATSENVGKRILIYYDNEMVSDPVVRETISGNKASIDGQASYEEAQQLASTIRIGALPLELKEVRSTVVGAKLGSEAISTSLIAGAIGFVLILIFMIVMYRIPGLAASLALCLYVAMMIICLNLFDVTLTLPGMAGIILSIGMAVDANVIIFTRIQEEIGAGKTVRSAMKNGFHKAMSAIIDGNVTTLIAAAVLYFLGSGTVKGFAQTLALGIILSMVTALFLTKFILQAFYRIGLDSEKLYGSIGERKTRNFIGHAKVYILISAVLILAGFVGMGVNKAKTGSAFNYGLDFMGGTSTEVTFPEDTADITNTELEKLVSDTLGTTAEITKVEGANSFLLKTRELSLEERTALADELVAEYGVDAELISTENISGSVSAQMRQDAVVAVLVAAVCMLIYIWVRFHNWIFAVSAVTALLHDVLVVLTVYAVCSKMIPVSSTFIACMLTIVGYSINATIVIFDRVRENMKEKLKKDSVAEIVNTSITETFSRSINTSLTTFVMVAVLAILGVESVREFAIPLMVGIVCGAYSSICITGTLWYAIHRRVGKTEPEA
ncbi:MAG: protein translocase subunit SecD [Lachnospiraceae bacterium]|nr:protein translocase subunit SecD [Lachnospiraceae bacterium]